MAKPAATDEYGLSPTLLKATSSRFPSPLSLQHRILGWSLAFISSAAFYLGPILLFAPVLIYFTVSTKVALWILFLDLILVLYPHKEWPRLRSIFQLWYELFHFRHNVTTETTKIWAKQNHLSILAMHPHGVIPLHGFLWAAFCDQYLPDMYGAGATTDVALKLPVLRQLLIWLSTGSAERKVIQREMQINDRNLYILPGGVAEIFFSRRTTGSKAIYIPDANSKGGKKKIGQTHILKARRYGLMKLALQTGSYIVPTYVFGGTEFFDQLATVTINEPTDDKSRGIKQSLGIMAQYASRRLKGGLTFFWGQYGTPLPHQTNVSMVLGDPIVPVIGTLGDESNGKEGASRKRTCKKIPNPTPEQVEELIDRYVDALERLFDQYKGQAGYENDVLEIR